MFPEKKKSDLGGCRVVGREQSVLTGHYLNLCKQIL